MSATAVSGRFTMLPDEHALQATVVALQEHGFSVEVAGDLDAARRAVLARIPAGSPVMTSTSVTLDQTGLADAVNDGGGRREPARNKMFALDFATKARQVKAIGGQPGYALGSVHAVTRAGTLAADARADLSAQPAAGGRPRAGRLRAAQPGREDPGDPHRTARPHPCRPHPPLGRLLTCQASPVCPQPPGGGP